MGPLEELVLLGEKDLYGTRCHRGGEPMSYEFYKSLALGNHVKSLITYGFF